MSLQHDLHWLRDWLLGTGWRTLRIVAAELARRAGDKDLEKLAGEVGK